MAKDHESQLVDLIASCSADPLRFVKVAFPWGELNTSLHDQTGPDVWQIELLTEIRDGLKTVNQAIQEAVSSGHGIGKAQGYDAVVETPTGQRRWGDLVVGDALFSGDGSATRIVGQRHFKSAPMYRVRFDDGTQCDVSSGHLWNVRGRQDRRNKRCGWRTMETIEILERGVKRRNGVSEARQWEIPVQGAAQYRHVAVPIDPYVMGIWLGDGGRNKGSITNMDAEVNQRIAAAGYTFSIGTKQGTEAKTIYIHGLRPTLRQMGILSSYAYEKRVPEQYLLNSINVRSEVLRGLMDTDGECGKGGCVQFCSTSKGLIDDVMWLARSLGGKAMLSPAVKYPFYRDTEGTKVMGRPAWRCTITMPSDFKTFYIERKQRRVLKVESRYLSRWIDSIEYIGEQDAMCVSVDDKSGLYLANDFIVTHNSAIVAWLILWAISTYEDTKGVVTANTETQLRTKTWPELAKWHRMFIAKHWFNFTATSLYSADPDHEKTWRIDAIPWSERNTEAFAGLHNQGKRILVVFDEGSAIPDIIWETTEGALTDKDTQIIWCVFGNPTRNTGRFRECFGRYRHRWAHRQIDSRTAKMTNKAQIDDWVKDYGEDSDFVRVRVRGVFPRAGSMQFISSELVELAVDREAESYLTDACVMGVDVARFGDDMTVIVVRRGRDACSTPWIKLRGADTMTVAAKVVEMAQEYKPDAIFVDGGGVGGGVIDRLNMLRQPVLEVQFGGTADKSNKSGEGDIVYANKRAEMWGSMRDWLKGGAIPDDPELVADLTGVEYGYTILRGRDAIQLEKKADMKKRGLASPDAADALAITFAYPVQPSDHTDQFKRGSNHQVAYDPLSREAALPYKAQSTQHQVDYIYDPRKG